MIRAILLILLVAASSLIQAQSRIEIVAANELSGLEKDGVKLVRLIGDVIFKQEQTLMYCDSAYQDKQANTFEAFGRVRINEKDSVFLNSRYLRYIGNERKAFVREEVQMTDGQMTLTTTQLDYDLKTRTAYYTNGGHVVNGDNVLDSKTGSYNANSKTFGFKKEVVLVNPEYVLKTDTLLYQTTSKVAYFFGPTTIESEDGFIYCENGWYNTYSQKARFSKEAYVINKDFRLSGDSLIYGGKQGLDTAIGNIQLIDTVNDITILGNYGVYDRNISEAIITQNPLAIIIMDNDSLFLSGDTLKSVTDTANKKNIFAYHTVRFFKEDMQGVSDSLHYSQADSTIYMEVSPILWNDTRQMKADSIRIHLKAGKVDWVDFLKNAVVVEFVDSGLYNQITGNNLYAWFEESRIKEAYVVGNTENIYFQEEDSVIISSMNYVICSEVRIRFDADGKAEEIVYIEKPDGTDYPIDQLPGEDKLFLKGFSWQQEIRPKSKEDVFHD